MISDSQAHYCADANHVRSYAPVKTLSIVSGKGGDGRTTLAINLGLCLARADHDVLLFDANLSLGTLDTTLNLQQRFNISDLVSDKKLSLIHI